MIQIFDVLRLMSGFMAGGIVGYGFGLVQERALRRNEQRQQSGGLSSGWAVMPGSMRRVAWLMIVLVAVQLICPLLFRNGTQWWVSGGVVLGYGFVLFRRLKLKKAGLKL